MQEKDQELSRTTSEPVYPPTSKVVLIVGSLFLSMFLIALDMLIIGVAIPVITDEFHSLGDVGWYGSAYLLTSCAFMLFMGRIYTFYNPKWVFISALFVFEVGSAICGAAPNSTALIVGRAVAGLGNAGLFQGIIVIIVYIVPLHKRPQIMGFGGLVFGVASAIGPLLGGAFTDGPGWRWCFYINLPCGAAVAALLVFFLHIPEEMLNKKSVTFKEMVQRLDPLGTICFLPCIVCLLLALQWGGVTYEWSNARIIVLLVLFGVLLIAFILIQWKNGENATVPSHIFLNRSILAGTWFSAFNGAAMQVMFYYLPIWFQAIKGASAVKSGIMSLPMVLGLVIASMMSGILTKRIGYYTPWMFVSSVLMPIGAGMITTFTPSTSHSAWIGYQALFGLGVGFGAQQPSVAAQTVLSRKDVATGASVTKFAQMLGGAVFLSVGNNLFDSRLARDFANIPDLALGPVVNIGATDLRNMVPTDSLSQVLIAYNDALRVTFYTATALACVTIFGALAMEWKSVKKDQPKGQKAEETKVEAV